MGYRGGTFNTASDNVKVSYRPDAMPNAGRPNAAIGHAAFRPVSKP
jgi:hypothetical protein